MEKMAWRLISQALKDAQKLRPSQPSSSERCGAINLGYRDPKTIRKGDFANREDDGVLLVPKAGEMLYQLKHPPKWAGGNRK